MKDIFKVAPNIINGAVYGNAYSTITPWVRSMGFHTNQLSYRENANLTSVAESYFINSMHVRGDPQSVYSVLQYLGDVGVTMISMNDWTDHSHLKKIKLPEGAPLDIALGEAIAKRRSIRKFTSDSMQLSYLATILRAGAGISAKANAKLMSGSEVSFSFRTYPSAGGLYPVSLYAAVFNIDKLENGIYQYQPNNDSLVHLMGEKESKQLIGLTAITEEMISLSQANVIILLSMRPWKSMKKYGARGLRFAFHEAGIISQNINLAVTALGLGSVDCASFYEDEVNSLLGLDGKTESFTHAIVIGNSA